MFHGEIVWREFAKQAAGFNAARLTLARQDYLNWIVTRLLLRSHFLVWMWPPGQAIWVARSLRM